MVFGTLARDSPLWLASGETFRMRFQATLQFLGLPWARGTRCLDGVEREPLVLASLRAGGATDLYLATEDLQLVQQRGGWNDQRVMGLYLL